LGGAIQIRVFPGVRSGRGCAQPELCADPASLSYAQIQHRERDTARAIRVTIGEVSRGTSWA